MRMYVYAREYHGTGSYPLPPHGWQRQMRLMASHNPLIAPCLFIASIAYCEQEGVKRQQDKFKHPFHSWFLFWESLGRLKPFEEVLSLPSLFRHTLQLKSQCK